MIEEKTEASEAIAAAKQEEVAAATRKPTVHIKVYSPFKTYYDEDSYSISAINVTGPFDILPRHHNFMTLLNPGEIIVRPVSGSREERIRISGGLMHVKADKITVFLDV